MTEVQKEQKDFEVNIKFRSEEQNGTPKEENSDKKESKENEKAGCKCFKRCGMHRSMFWSCFNCYPRWRIGKSMPSRSSSCEIQKQEQQKRQNPSEKQAIPRKDCKCHHHVSHWLRFRQLSQPQWCQYKQNEQYSNPQWPQYCQWSCPQNWQYEQFTCPHHWQYNHRGQYASPQWYQYGQFWYSQWQKEIHRPRDPCKMSHFGPYLKTPYLQNQCFSANTIEKSKKCEFKPHHHHSCEKFQSIQYLRENSFMKRQIAQSNPYLMNQQFQFNQNCQFSPKEQQIIQWRRWIRIIKMIQMRRWRQMIQWRRWMQIKRWKHWIYLKQMKLQKQQECQKDSKNEEVTQNTQNKEEVPQNNSLDSPLN